jgi:hypothetical protein
MSRVKGQIRTGLLPLAGYYVFEGSADAESEEGVGADQAGNIAGVLVTPIQGYIGDPGKPAG